ncbi:MAG TPA: branched-chain amino acid ABC transporter permease [Anaerolineales bacterium]|nr:branched-chain amino acid ABC transporter permease [Anaerolineales bacterium]
MNWFPRRVRLLTLALVVALLLPIFVHSPYALHVMVLLGIWVVLAESLNFVTGFAGQLALGHAAFVTLGGYAGALLMVNNGWPFWPALLVGGGTGFVTGLILGLMALRLRGDYLGMVTLGFGEIVRLLAVNLVDITRGPMGVPGIPRPVIFGFKFHGELPFFYLILALIVFTHMSIERMLFSRFGRACLAIRDDEIAAQAMGVKPYRYKVLAFCISSAYAGLMGVFYCSWATFFSPDAFKLDDSIMLSVMITLGGIGSLVGAIPGAIGIGALPELLRPFTTGARVASLRLAGVGLVMVVFLILRPQGIAGMSIEKDYISLEPLRRLFVRGSNSKPEKT